MNFGQAISNCFSNYATFSGRAPRSEYCYFCLFLLVGNICTLVADVLILGDMEDATDKSNILLGNIAARIGGTSKEIA